RVSHANNATSLSPPWRIERIAGGFKVLDANGKCRVSLLRLQLGGFVLRSAVHTPEQTPEGPVPAQAAGASVQARNLLAVMHVFSGYSEAYSWLRLWA